MDESRILLVDDEENLRRSMEKTLFREGGYDVETAGGNVEGFETYMEAIENDEPFNLVIVDLNMPDFDGKEKKYAGLSLLAKIKEQTPDLPIIVNSAWDEVEIAKKCIDAGATDYFVKGRNDQMLAKIRAALGIGRSDD